VWMNEKPDVIIASDCVYLEIAFQPLIDTLVMLSNEKTEIYLCYKRRRKADKRFFMLARKKFTLTEVCLFQGLILGIIMVANAPFLSLGFGRPKSTRLRTTRNTSVFVEA
jgi:hypothetical protein